MSPETPLWFFGLFGAVVEALLWWFVNDKFEVKPRHRGVGAHFVIGFVVGLLAGALLKDALT